MKNYLVWTKDNAPKGIKLKKKQRVRWVFDELHETVGSYAYDTKEETKAAEALEIEALNSGECVALGVILEQSCRCGNYEHGDSCWGIVIETNERALVDFYKGSGFSFPKREKKYTYAGIKRGLNNE